METDPTKEDSEIKPVEPVSPAKVKPAEKKRGGKLWLWFKRLFFAGGALGTIVLVCVFVYIVKVTADLPDVDTLKEYTPSVMTRVHAGDGKLITEYAIEHRVFVPHEAIPKDLQHAFVAAEDQRFYKHKGIDWKGFIRAQISNIGNVLKGDRLEGGSTITQQVAKNFLVGNERSVDRKIREMFIAKRIERAMSKDEIMELYLNEIYFGRRAYGIAAASLNYFAKPLDQLDRAEMAYLAVLPKAPNNYHPIRKKERALARRNYVLNRMVDDEYITQEEADAAKEEDLIVSDRLLGEEYLAAEYFVEEARKQIFGMYGEDVLYEGGLSIRTTLDTRMQLAARQALRKGLEDYDRRHGYRGPLTNLAAEDDVHEAFAAFETPRDIGDWRVALVTEAKGKTAKLSFLVKDPDPVGEMDNAEELAKAVEAYEAEIKANAEARDGTIAVSDIKWAGEALPGGRFGTPPKTITDAIKEGDVILVQRKPGKTDDYNLRQIPAVNGGIVAMDPHTGRVLALVGGYSFDQSQFNRATQAYRQPGSSFKPFVYAAAMDNGYTPSSQVLDAPFVIERQDDKCDKNLRRGSRGDVDCERYYKPSNYDAGTWYGMSTLRLGLEKSRNAMTVRLANDIGMDVVGDYATSVGIYDEFPQEQLAMALGAGETTLLRMATAYSMLVNGGKRITPTIMDRVQDGAGKTIFTHDNKICYDCKVEEWTGAPPPNLADEREQVLDPVTAYQVAYMLKGVVDNGTGRSISVLGRPLGGKTGTTNDFKDAWFMGFSPDLVAGVYVGFDNPVSMGRETGGKAAAPIFRDFMGEALKDEAIVPFRIPAGVTLAPVNRSTGVPSFIGAEDYILEAFRPGTEPQLGGLGSTIRVGSGTDTLGTGFGNGNFNRGASHSNGLSTIQDKPEPPGKYGYHFEVARAAKPGINVPMVKDKLAKLADGENLELSKEALDELWLSVLEDVNAIEEPKDLEPTEAPDEDSWQEPEGTETLPEFDVLGDYPRPSEKDIQAILDFVNDEGVPPTTETAPQNGVPVDGSLAQNDRGISVPVPDGQTPPPPLKKEEDLDDGLY